MNGIYCRFISVLLIVVSPEIASAQAASTGATTGATTGTTAPPVPLAPPELTTLCNLSAAEKADLLAPMLVGTWTSLNGAGTLSGIGAPVILPPQSEQFINTITLVDGAFNVSTDRGDFPMEFYEGNLNFNPPDSVVASSQTGNIQAFDNETLSMATGCDEMNDLPKLHGFGSFIDAGGEVEFDNYLVVLSTNILYGVVIGRITTANGTMVARRSVKMTK